MKKVLFFITLGISLLFSAINVQTASKEELMCIKGIGEKKADEIIKYRKSHKLDSIDDLIEVKGIGKVLIDNIKNDIKSANCNDNKKSTKKAQKSKNLKKEKKKEDSKKESNAKEKNAEKGNSEDKSS